MAAVGGSALGKPDAGFNRPNPDRRPPSPLLLPSCCPVAHAVRWEDLPTVNFRLLFDLSPNPYMLIDRELRYVEANPAYVRATGTSLEDLIGRYIFEVFPNDPDDPAKFERGIRARSSLERSLGLGLFISKQIVLAHGGRIDVRSTAEEGTTFTVALPRRATVPAAG